LIVDSAFSAVLKSKSPPFENRKGWSTQQLPTKPATVVDNRFEEPKLNQTLKLALRWTLLLDEHWGFPHNQAISVDRAQCAQSSI
jgi:hypothetical protein